MLYFFYNIFNLNIFQYISVRMGFSFFIAFFITVFMIPIFIKWALYKNSQQPINKYVPSHNCKKNTPTMGGIIFIFATLISIILTAKLNNLYILISLFLISGFTIIGYIDDRGKILHRDNLKGLSSKKKLLLLSTFSLIISLILVYFAGFSTEIYLPFLKNPIMDSKFFSIILWTFVFIATTNAVNLTDGLDGLATIPSVIALLTLGIIVYITGHFIISGYLLLPNIKGVGETAIVASSLTGALLGFLWYNCYPAEIFMGDSGSLAVGGVLAYLAILGKSEALLVLIGFIFVIETFSVILQIGSCKLRGKKIFLMSPIHHHFELKKWAENKIIVRFWIISAIINLIALITLKIR